MSDSAQNSTRRDGKTLRVTLVKSLHGRLKNHQQSVRGLGLRRMHQTVEVIDTPENRGMINTAYYMLRVEEPLDGATV